MKTILAAVVLAAFITILAPASAGACTTDHGLGYRPESQHVGSGAVLPKSTAGVAYADYVNRHRALAWRAFGLKHRPRLIRLCRITGAHPLPAWYPPMIQFRSWRAYGDACKAWAVAIYRREMELRRIVASGQ